MEVVNEIFDNEVTYTGSITDTSTGLQYMGSRYYDSSTGRFLTQGTYTGNVYEPWTQHLYTYCGNNPTNMIDPTGHKPIWFHGKGNIGEYTDIDTGTSLRDKIVKPAFIQLQRHGIILDTGTGTPGYNANTSEESTGTTSNENSNGGSTNESGGFWGAVGDVLGIIVESVEVEAGVGPGFGVAGDVDVLSITAWYKTDVMGFRIDDGQVSCVAHRSGAFRFGAAYWSYGPHEEAYRTYYFEDDNLVDDDWQIESTETVDFVLGPSVGLYVGYGASISVGINLDELYYSLKEYFS